MVLLLTEVASPSSGEHWAFVPPAPTRVPAGAEAPWVRHPIDAFILDSMIQNGLQPNATATSHALLRRVSLDLRGLPPSLMEQGVFLTSLASSLDPIDRLIDRWLASPHYGERMTQSWLDLARYADTTGHAADQPRTMWPYRDWVLSVLNEDLPYDVFTLHQLAGDRLPHPSEAQLIATGFHRNSMQALGNNPRKEEFRVRGIVDRLDVTGQVWLGLSLACAECHDHKHDPITQKEYYQLYAIFNQVPHYGEKFDVHGPRLRVRRWIDGEAREVEAQIMDTLATPRETHVHLRGDFETKGERVSPALPAIFQPEREARSMDRLGFAEWLISDSHPLTARVAVNRAWQQYLGRGIVATMNDFGKHGEAPSHPELLDWLARRFQHEGWSMKRLHRDFLSTATYRQNAHVDPEELRRDPDNRWCARASRFRLSAENLRDQALSVSGLISHQLGGPSVFPPQPEGVGEFRDATAGEWKASEGKDRYRRSLYTFWQRMAPHPAMTTFDAPSREWCVTERARTNTPLQALAMLNEPTMVETQQAFARRLRAVPLAKRLDRAFQLALARLPDSAERKRWQPLLDAKPEAEGARFLATVLLNLDEFLTRP